MIEPNHFDIPPWKSPEVWSQVFLSMEHMVGQHPAGLKGARDISGQICKKYAEIDEAIDSVCKETCWSCQEICCKRATVWYDYKDMLFIYLHSGRFPEAQITKNGDLACCNLTPTGCLLPRSIRPFICTWYMCPSQMALLSARVVEEPKVQILSSIKEIQALRNRLEHIFIKAVVG